jgi:hypothetical protein
MVFLAGDNLVAGKKKIGAGFRPASQPLFMKKIAGMRDPRV